MFSKYWTCPAVGWADGTAATELATQPRTAMAERRVIVGWFMALQGYDDGGLAAIVILQTKDVDRAQKVSPLLIGKTAR